MAQRRSLTNIDKTGRSAVTGQVAKNCRCIQHDQWNVESSEKERKAVNLVKDKGKTLPKYVESVLREKNILSGSFICKGCAVKARSIFGGKSNSGPAGEKVDSDSDAGDEVPNDDENNVAPVEVMDVDDEGNEALLDEINEGMLAIAEKIKRLSNDDQSKVATLPISELLLSNVLHDLTTIFDEELPDTVKTDMNNLLEVVGRQIRGDILCDLENIRSIYKDPDELMNMNTVQYIKERDSSVVSFLKGVAHIDFDRVSEQLSFEFARTIEQVYHLRHHKIIMSHSFVSNLVQYYTSGSKTVPVINGKLSPAGSYTTVMAWMAETGKDELKCPPGDIETYVDNIGRYHIKNYRVTANEYKKSRIFTTGIHILLSDEDSLQKRSDLIPREWGKDLSTDQIQDQMKELIANSRSQFAYYHAKFLEQILDYVLNEDDVVQREIDVAIQKNLRICSNEKCQKLYSTLKYKCDVCNEKVVKYSPAPVDYTGINPDYKFTLEEVQNKQNTPFMSMAEPVFVNPNSYDNVKVILEQTKKTLQIGAEREWSYIGCDGPPYVIASRLIDENPDTYSWVAMSNGLGHLYMNQMKTLFNVARHILLEDMARDVLHFESPNAQKHFFRCSDTHKTYQSLEILLYGTTMEMVHSYVTNCTSQPTVEGFLDWNPNNTYHVVRQLILNYALAIFITKIGDRNNNIEVHNAGRFKFMDLFFAFEHPIYQEIEYRDLQQKVVMPEEVKAQRHCNLTYTKSSKPQKHQGGDFILENKVKRQKMLASKGVDTEKMWKQVARSLDDIDKISINFNSKLNLHDVDGVRNIDGSLEVMRWRALIRDKDYLMKHNDNANVFNIKGNMLSSDMINISENANELMCQYFDLMKNQRTVQRGSLKKLNVLPNETLDDLLYEIDDEVVGSIY